MSKKKHLATTIVEAFIDADNQGIELVPVLAGSTSATKISPLVQAFPDRLVNVGIA